MKEDDFVTDFWEQSTFFFITRENYDTASIQVKWDHKKEDFFKTFLKSLSAIHDWKAQH